MSTKLKAVVALLVLAFIALVVWAVNSVPEAPESVEPSQHVMSYDGNTIRETKDGKVIWEMTADTIDVVAETKMVTLNNVKCHYYTEDNKVIDLQGDKATYNQANDDVDLLENIKGKSSDGYTMSCKKVTWLAKEQKLVMNGDVKMDNKEQHIEASADTIEAIDNFNKFTMKGKAHMGKNLPEKKSQ